VKSIEEQAKELAMAFSRKGIELTTALHRGVEAACLVVESSAKALSPVDTGLLKMSINHRTVDVQGGSEGQVGTQTEYAPFQEFGTVKMKAQPFLTPALNANKATVKSLIESSIKKEL
jgi:HK97 gp10 family phage protein